MITFELDGRDVKVNKKRVKILLAQLPKKAYYHFLFEPELIIRVYNKDKKYLAEYCQKKKWKYKTYRYPFPKKGYGEDKKAVTYIYRDEFIPLFNLESRFALKAKKKHKLSIIERSYHTMLNSFGYEWATEARITNWLLAGRVNTIKKYEGDGAIISLLCIMILFLTKINRVLIKGLQ